MHCITSGAPRPQVRRARRAIAAIGVVTIMALTGSGCGIPTITWQEGQTHAATIEAGAGRANLVLFERYSDALWAAFDSTNTISTVIDLIYQFGVPPTVRVCVGAGGTEICYSHESFRLIIIQALFNDNRDDIRQAMYDMHAANDCLAWTFISGLQPDSNWTHKSGGCRYDGAAGDPTVIEVPVEPETVNGVLVEPSAAPEAAPSEGAPVEVPPASGDVTVPSTVPE
jgi:hypothetical protein